MRRRPAGIGRCRELRHHASMDRRERKRQQRHHHLSVEGVEAFLTDKDADLYNITDAAVREDPLAAAWNLTALAAAAIRKLAQETGRSPVDVLEELEAEGFGGLVRTGKPARKARDLEE